MNFKYDYRSLIVEGTNDDFFKAKYDDALNKYNSRNRYLFCEALQKLVVAIGLVMSSVLNYPSTNSSNCSGLLNYLCIDVLGEKEFYKSFTATKFNKKGNAAKHRKNMKVEEVKIETIASKFNKMISMLCTKIKDNTLLKYKLIRKDNTDIISDEEMERIIKFKYEKYFMNKNINNKNINNKKLLNQPKKKENKKIKKKNLILDKHKSSINNKNLNVSAYLLNDEGRAYKMSLMKKKEIFMFGIYIDYKSNYKLTKIEVLLKTKTHEEILKAKVGENRFEVDSSFIDNGLVDVIVRTYYWISLFKYNYKDINLKRKYK